MWTRIGNKTFELLIIIFSVTLMSVYSFAEDISFQATVNTNKISLQDMLELTLSVQGAKVEVSAISLPPIDGFDARFVGPSMKFTIINGVSTREHAFIYNLFPSKTGRFQIPSIPLTLNGQNYKTSPIDVEVIANPADSNSPDEGEVSKDLSIYDKVFMKAALGTKEVYVGEQTPLMMRIYVKGLSLQLAGAPAVKPDGFVADATANMQKSKEVMDGLSYDSLKFETNIYPNRVGNLSVGPFQAVGELVYRVKQSSNDIFGELFATTESRPITLTAPAVALNVLPLPTKGQPADFSGAVGQYDFKASVGPASVKVGDPLTLRMAISGKGRLKNLTMPVFNDSRFKTYDAEIKEAEGSVSVEQVIIPTAKDIVEVPALSFSYFDSQEKKYKTITQGPFPVTVIALATGEEFKAYGFIDKTKVMSDKPTGFGLKSFIQESLQRTKTILKDLRFWGCIIILGILWLSFTMWQEFQNRLQRDESFAREWKADSKAKELLKNTKDCLQKGNAKEFYSSLYKTLNDYLADKMHVPVAGLTWDKIDGYLVKRSVDSSKLASIKELFDRSDLVRFASSSMSSDQMSKDFQQLETLVQYLPKILK